MKTLLFLLLFSWRFGALAQQPLSSTDVTTDGRQLHIRVDINQPGRPVHYSRSFDVSALDEPAIRLLRVHVLDSLNQRAALSDTEPANENRRSSRNETSRNYSERLTQNERDGRAEAKAGHPLSPGDVAPLSVLYREDKVNGRLWMQYIFRRDDEELIVERTASVTGKTERDKQAIIRETERSLGIKSTNQ